jgi:hypothetical protein
VRRWEDREMDLGAVVGEVRRLMSRARHRWVIVLALTLLFAAGLTGREVRKQRFYESTIVLTATEGEHAEDAVAHAAGKLVDHVYHAVFTDKVLTELMVKYGYRPDLQEKNPRLALEQFRDFISVEVYKNEFTQPRYPMAPPRSARIAVSMRYMDPDQALAIVRDLGDLVVKRDADLRRERFEAQARVAGNMVAVTRGEIERLTEELEFSLAAEEVLPNRRGEYKVKSDGAARALMGAEARLKEAEDSKAKLDLSKNADSHSLELRFERADWGAPEKRENRTLLLIRTALVGFFGLLPIVALTVGAFDPRVYDERDVERLGLRFLGNVRNKPAGGLRA